MNAKLSPVPLVFHVESDTITELTNFIETQARHNCARIVLAEKVGEQNHPVGEWLLEDMLDARSLATTIYGTANREASALRESVAYGVFAIHPDAPGSVGRFVFRIEAGNNGLGANRKADEQTVLRMLIDHNEMSARLSLGHSREIVDQYQTLLIQQNAHAARQLDVANARIRVLEEREAAAIEAHQELQSRVVERTAEIEAAKRNDDRRDEMRRFGMEKLGLLLPLIAAKLGAAPAVGAAAGSPPGGAARDASATDDLVDALIQSMPGEQAKSIASLLTQDQQVLFIHLYEASLARVARRRASASEPGAPAEPTAVANDTSLKPSSEGS